MEIEAQVRQAFAAQGLTAERLGAAEYEQELRAEVRRLESQGSTQPASVALAARLPKRAPVELPPEPPRVYGCAWCQDARMVLVTADRDDPRFGDPVPCPECTSVEERLALYGVPERFRAMTVETMQRLPGKAEAIAFVGQWDGQDSVILHSSPDALSSKWGVGKSQIAVLLLRREVEAGRGGKFITSVDLLASIRATFDDKSSEQTAAVLDRLARHSLLVIDDLGAERPTDWTREQVRTLLDKRDSEKRPTIISTNYCGPEELADAVGGAVASRLRRAVWVAVGGVDLRGVAE